MTFSVIIDVYIALSGSRTTFPPVASQIQMQRRLLNLIVPKH